MKIYIYGIKCLETGKIYIGSTDNLKTRMSSHLSLLKGGKHHILELQKDFNLFGIKAFDLDILGVCDLKNRFEHEKYFIKEYTQSAYNVYYNLAPKKKKSKKCVILNDYAFEELCGFKKHRQSIERDVLSSFINKPEARRYEAKKKVGLRVFN